MMLNRYRLRVGYINIINLPPREDTSQWIADHFIWDEDLCKFVDDNGEIFEYIQTKCLVKATPITDAYYLNNMYKKVNKLNEDNDFYDKALCEIIDSV